MADWRTRAACRGVDTELFFPTTRKGVPAAVKYCTGCPVREQCADEAKAARIGYGVWGGRRLETAQPTEAAA